MWTTILSSASVLAGVVLGAFLTKILDSYGKVRCKASVKESVAAGMFGTIEEKPRVPIDYDTFSLAGDITFFVDTVLINEKDKPLTLWDIALHLVAPDGSERRLVTYKRDPEDSFQEIRKVDLPANGSAELKLTSGLKPEMIEEEGKNIDQYTSLEFRAKYPNDRLYKGKVTFPETLPDPMIGIL